MLEDGGDERPEAMNVGAIADEDLAAHVLVEPAIGRARRGRQRGHDTEHTSENDRVNEKRSS